MDIGSILRPNLGRSSDKGFRTAPLIRFVGKEDGLLSYTEDIPRVFLNIEDYLFYNQARLALYLLSEGTKCSDGMI